MVDNNVDIIDIGGESSRPGAEVISVEEELKRVLPCIKMIREISKDIPISIDTVKSEVAKQSLDAGANIINDISGGIDDNNMLKVVSEYKCPYIVMHKRGDAKTMDNLTEYSDVIQDVSKSLNNLINNATDAGLPLFNIIADPGLGFAKTNEQNCLLINKADEISKLINNVPLLYGPSRKRFIGHYTKKEEPLDRIMGTAACTTYFIYLFIRACVMKGVQFIRVHDFKEMKDVISMSNSILNPK